MSEATRGQATQAPRVPLPTTIAATCAHPSVSSRDACLTRVGEISQTDSDNPVVPPGNSTTDIGVGCAQPVILSAQLHGARDEASAVRTRGKRAKTAQPAQLRDDTEHMRLLTAVAAQDALRFQTQLEQLHQHVLSGAARDQGPPGQAPGPRITSFAPPPAPATPDCELLYQVDVSSLNLTSLAASGDLLLDIDGIVGIQEHQMPLNCHKARRKRWRRNGKGIFLGPPCADAGHSSAGAGVQWPSTIVAATTPPKSAAYKKALKRGRVAHAAIVLSPALSFFLFSIYGFVGGAEELYAAL